VSDLTCRRRALTGAACAPGPTRQCERVVARAAAAAAAG